MPLVLALVTLVNLRALSLIPSVSKKVVYFRDLTACLNIPEVLAPRPPRSTIRRRFQGRGRTWAPIGDHDRLGELSRSVRACINKDNHVELSEAITSMFGWYHTAKKRYVYLSDVSASNRDGAQSQREWEVSFRASRWFTRGWTLQELLAPRDVEFFSREGELLGNKKMLVQQVHEITTIPVAALEGTPLPQFSISERIRWTEKRSTKKKEDQAYCLLGIFGVFMPLIYGEGDNALRRLRKEIHDQFGSDVAACFGDVGGIRSLGLCWGSAPLIDKDDFIGRGTELDQMTQVLQPGEPSVEQRQLVLGGLGGIGKTQLAIAYARRHQERYTSVFWLNATSEPTLKASFRSIAQQLLTEPELKNLDEEGTVRAIFRWLSSVGNTRWLLIFDNYDNPELYSMSKYLPNTANGSILITTRTPNRLKGRRTKQVRVSPMEDLEECLKVLQARSQRESAMHDPDARRLVERLAGLPLALATAGAYLRKTTLTFSQYLEAYEQRFNVHPQRPIQLEEYQDRTLYTTWDLSYKQIKNDDPLAAKALKLLAYFDNQEIWFELFHAGLRDEFPEWLREIAGERIDFENMMGTLAEYCLLETHPAQGSYSMHSCVHDWALVHLNQAICSQFYLYTVACVAGIIDNENWEALGQLRYARLARHGHRCAHPFFGRVLDAEASFFDDGDAIERIAGLLAKQVQLTAAEQMYMRALAGKEKALGPDHTSTLNTVNNLGLLYRDQGKLVEAEQMYLRALAGYEKALGPNHTSTLATINNLGLLYGGQGKLV